MEEKLERILSQYVEFKFRKEKKYFNINLFKR